MYQSAAGTPGEPGQPLPARPAPSGPAVRSPTLPAPPLAGRGTGPEAPTQDTVRSPALAPLPPTASSSFSPALPPLPPDARRLSLSESLVQLQNEAAFVQRPPPQSRPATDVASPPTVIFPGPSPPVELDAPAESEFFVAGLTAKELFVRLPQADPVSALLERHIPPDQRPLRDLSGDWRGRTLDELITSYNWRGVARYAYDAITQASPERTSYILSHWLLRFHTLFRLRLFEPLSYELQRVASLLPPSSCLFIPPDEVPAADTPRFHPAVPYELHVLFASLPGIEGDRRAAIERLAALLRALKEEMWAAKKRGEADKEGEWRARVERVAGLVTALLQELKATTSATSLLAPLAAASPSFRTALSRIHFATGDVGGLSAALDAPEVPERQRRKTRVLDLVARADWAEAEAELRRLTEEEPDDVEAHNNLAVVLLYSAKLDEAITHLTTLFSSRPALAYNDETLLFNLCTLFELRSEQAFAHKVRLLRSAAEFGAQGLGAECFKLPL